MVHPSGVDCFRAVVVSPGRASRTSVWSDTDLDDLLTREKAITPDAEAFARLEEIVRYALQRSRTFAPSFAEHVHWRKVEAECLRRLAAVLTSSSAGPLFPSPGARERITRLADEFIESRLDEPLSILDVCREVEVSERTLRYAFQERFGMGPKAYLKKLQLNAVRHALKTADPRATTVHAVAQQWGFWHTGAFSADYRSLFGELPSKTLGC